MKIKIWLFILLCSSAYCRADIDSLKLFFNTFNSTLNTKTGRIFTIKSSFKPFTLTDPLINNSLIKVYNSSRNDSINDFYILSNDTLGYFYHNKSLFFFELNNKSVGEVILDDSYVKYLKKQRRDILFFPLVANYSAINFKPMQKQTVIIEKDSLYYRGVDKVDDSSCFVRTVILKKVPSLTITYKEEFTDSVSNIIQLKQYDVNEVGNSSQTLFPQKLSKKLEQMFPDFWIRVFDTRPERQVRNIKEGSCYIEWTGVSSNGDTINSSQIKCRYLIMDFWYMHCYWCWKAIDELSKFNSSIDTNYIQIIGINPFDIDHKAEALKLFKDKGGNYPIVYDHNYDYNKKIIKDYEVHGYPTIFVIDLKNNEIIFCEEGYKEGLYDRLKNLIFNSDK